MRFQKMELARVALRWDAQVVTEIMARAAVAPVPVMAFHRLE